MGISVNTKCKSNLPQLAIFQAVTNTHGHHLDPNPTSLIFSDRKLLMTQ